MKSELSFHGERGEHTSRVSAFKATALDERVVKIYIAWQILPGGRGIGGIR